MKAWILSLWLFPFCLLASSADEVKNDLQKIDKTLKTVRTKIKSAEPKAIALQKKLIFIEAQLKAYREARIHSQAQIEIKQKEINSLKKEEKNEEAAVEKSKQRLAKWLNYSYRHPPILPIVLVLQGKEPNKSMQDIAYFKFLQHKQMQVIQNLKKHQQEIRVLAERKEKERQEIEVLNKKQALLEKVEQEKKEQLLRAKKDIESLISGQRRNITRLEADRERLSALIARSTALEAAKTKMVSIKNRKNSTVQDRMEVKREKISSVKRQSIGNLTAEDMQLTNSDKHVIVDSSEALEKTSFYQLKGHLLFPLDRGQVQYVYGQQRDDGSISKGFVIESAGSDQVRSVANGKVVFAGSMGAYGLTVVVVHDPVYVSVYAEMGSISVHSGMLVNQGTSLGVAGKGEDLKERVYFELREHVHPINPRDWF